MRVLWRILQLGALAAFILWLIPRLEEMHREVDRGSDSTKQSIRLEGVVVTTVDADGLTETRVTGQVAEMDKKMKDLEIRPARVEVFKAGVHESTLTAKTARKRTPVGKKAERFEFEGNVVGRSADGRQVYGEEIHYYPSVKELQAPVPATILTTDTRMHGDKLWANLDLQRGKYRGNVRLQHLPTKGASRSEPLAVTGEQAEFDLKANHHRFEGKVEATQATLKLNSQTLDFFQEKSSLVAVGDVVGVDGDLTLSGQQVEYRLDTRRALVRGSPKVIQRKAATGEKQELTAREIVASNPGGWVKGLGSVRLVTFVKVRGRLKRDAEILGDEVEAFNESGRATFKNNVRILSQKTTAKGQNAVYYRDSRRVYLNGRAEAAEKGPDGKVIRRVHGEHILHHLDTGKSVVLGGIHGQVQGGR